MIQLVINYLYRYPKTRIKKSLQLGGPIRELQTHLGEKAMKESVSGLEPIKWNPDSKPLEPVFTFLTGSRFYHQTIYCIKSLVSATHFRYKFRFKILDDGSMTDSIEATFKRVVPDVVIERLPEINNRIDQFLPEKKYHALRTRRNSFFLIRKLTDVHAGIEGATVFLDSDMLFFNEPTELINWCSSPRMTNFGIEDIEQSYGFDLDTMKEVAGTGTVPEKLNSGLTGLYSPDIDFERLQDWMIRTETTTAYGNYYLEQSLTAMLIAQKNYILGRRPDYLVMPTSEQVTNRIGVLHHYVNISKPDYFIHAWKKIL